jgi:hypothetical protein
MVLASSSYLVPDSVRIWGPGVQAWAGRIEALYRLVDAGGANFVASGTRPAEFRGGTVILAGEQVPLPKTLAFSVLTAAACSRRDWAAAAYLCLDPLPALMESLGPTV